MATRAETIEHLLDCAGSGVTARKMFGEYALYHRAKVVALVCGDELFVKPTVAGRARLGEIDEAPPYPGAKPHWRVDADRWEDGEWLAGLLAATAEALPEPKPKKPRARRASGP